MIGTDRERALEALQSLGIALELEQKHAAIAQSLDIVRHERENPVITRKRVVKTA